MPYQIPGETPAMTRKMERCVDACMGRPVKKYKGRTKKESCIAICKASIMGTSASKRASSVAKTWKSRKK